MKLSPLVRAVRLTLLFFLMINSNIEAGILQHCVALMMIKGEDLVVAQMKSHEYGVHEFTLESGEKIKLAMGDKLGSGFFGSVYDLEAVDGLVREGLMDTGFEVVAKMPHNDKYQEAVNLAVYAHSANPAEAKLYDDLVSLRAPVSRSDHYPADWPEDFIPVAPILRTLDTTEGTILLKGKVPGKSLKDLAKLYGDTLPPDIEKGLKDIFSWVTAVDENVPGGAKARQALADGGEFSGSGFSTDIRPPNLVWVDDPVLLKNLGLKGPVFMLYEFSQVPANLHWYAGKGFPNYLEEFKTYMRGSIN
ncbi:MAG: hypothetical protein HOE90_05120 [Bacteriovoracaceae bacterium]|jgi:hypothetical protein|nr:hypothetical protein [Bacteriovoracaceae bacterium]